MSLRREVSKYDSLYILLEQRGKVCKQLPIGWQKTKRRTALYTSSNKLKRQKNIYWSIVIIISLRRTKQILKTGPAATQAILLSEMTLSLFGFVTCLQNHTLFTDKIMWYPIIHIGMYLAPIESAKFLSLSETATSAHRWVLIPNHRKIDQVHFPWSGCLPIFGCVP